MRSTKLFLYLFIIFTVFIILSLTCFYFFNYKSNTSIIPPQTEPQSTTPTLSYPTVIIDAGHGGEDGGAIGKNGAYEKDINLEIAKKLKSKLDALGIPCVLTRSTDILLYDPKADYEGKKKKLDLLARKEFAEKYADAIFISIHQNSYPKEQYSGFQVYYSPNNDASGVLADLLENSASTTLTETRCRPSKVGTSSIYLLDKLQCPAVLVECGFISNAEECLRLCDEEYQNRLCEAIVAGIVEFMN